MSQQQKSVAILGNGVVGVAVAKGFAELGYKVIFGTRDPTGEKMLKALAEVPGASAASFADAAKQGDLAFVALPWDGLAAGLQSAGAAHLAGKLVIDASNPLVFGSTGPQLALGFSDSAGETVQRLLPQARVVKAFNTITAGHMVHPKLADGVPDMLMAGNDAPAKQEVAALLQAFGWRKPIDMGDITASRLIEPLAMLWISYGTRNNHWTHGFSLLGQKA
jgi:8-hydroxy-5-deazaflavin:NADPH oxidoreductase